MTRPAVTVSVAAVADHALPVLLAEAYVSEAWTASFRDYPIRAEAEAAERIAHASSSLAVRFQRDASPAVVRAATDLDLIVTTIRGLARVAINGTGTGYANATIARLARALA